jgi:hypothetical protein
MEDKLFSKNDAEPIIGKFEKLLNADQFNVNVLNCKVDALIAYTDELANAKANLDKKLAECRNIKPDPLPHIPPEV